MFWLYLALGGYFFLAVAAVGDRLLLASSAVNPARYVFLIGVAGGVLGIFLSALNLIFPEAPAFAFILPANSMFLIGSAFVAGAFYLVALFIYFYVLNKVEASRVIPVQGALVSIFTLVLALVFLQQQFEFYHFLIFGVLVLGAFLVSYKDRKNSFVDGRNILPLVLSALFFALHYGLVKNVYNSLPFIESLIFVQLGFVVAGPVLYAIFGKRYMVEEDDSVAKPSNGAVFVFINQSMGLAGGAFLQYAIYKGNVVFVNALQGAQYVFLFILLLLTGRLWGKFLSETYSRKLLAQKILGIVFIAVGIAMIYLKG